jgi:hypothetical protein
MSTETLAIAIRKLPTVYQRTQATIALTHLRGAAMARQAGRLADARELLDAARSRLRDLELVRRV